MSDLTSKEVPGSVEQYARALEYERGEVLRAIDEIDRLKRELDKAREANRLAIHTGLKQEALIAELWASQEATGARAVVDEQAEDEGLWFDAETVGEELLQQALRRLHAAVEDGAPHEPSEDAGDAALRFYADAGKYRGGFDDDGGGHRDRWGYEILDDAGQRARDALTKGETP